MTGLNTLIDTKLSILEKAPLLLTELLAEVPREILKLRRIPTKWSIHEHTCHLAEAQKMIIERFEVFKSTEYAVFKPYLPGKDDTQDDHLLQLDLRKSLTTFEKDRKSLVILLQGFDKATWKRAATHPEYKQFNADIFLRHVMMHDHLHMYRIEQLWLTNEEYL